MMRVRDLRRQVRIGRFVASWSSSAKDKPRIWEIVEDKLSRGGTVADLMASNENTAKNYKKSTGVGTDAFQPQMLLDLSNETCRTVADYLHVVEVIWKWPTTAICIMFFLVQHTVENCRPLAFLD